MTIKPYESSVKDDDYFVYSKDNKINKDSLYKEDLWFYKTNPRAFLRSNRGVSSEFLQKNIYGAVKRFGLAIDVGARVGEWSRYLGQDFNTVIAFEPRRKWCECFVKNVKMKNVSLFNYGLGSGKFSAQMRGNSIQSLGPYENIGSGISVINLDKLKIKNIDFMKIDTDGHELEVLLGAKKTIKRERPVIYIETIESYQYFNGKTHLDHCKFLEDMGMIKLYECRRDDNRLYDTLYGWSENE